MIVLADNFSLDQIANSGQCFRWKQVIGDGYHIQTVKGNIFATSNGETVLITSTDYTDEELREYFDLDTDYKAIIDAIPEDDYFLLEAAEEYKGIRILRQDLWETIISFIISQNNNIPRIKGIIEKMCDAYGCFPLAKDIVTRPELLKQCSLGYRDEYILEFAQNVVMESSVLDKLNELKSVDAFKLYKGIGNKVANCICLFGCHDLSCCPEDVWVKRLIQEKYNGIKPAWMQSEYAGIYQQYCFEKIRKFSTM